MSDILDKAHLAEFSGGDPELEREVLAMFRGHAADYLAALARAGTPNEFRALAHKLKGAARAVGARQLGDLAEAAERAGAAAEHLEACQPHLEPLEAAFIEVGVAIDAVNA